MSSSVPGTPSSEEKVEEVLVKIKSSELEKILTRRLIVEDNDDDYVDEADGEYSSPKAIEYGIRYDAHWLKCHPPKFQLMTILGLLEDSHHYNDDDDDEREHDDDENENDPTLQCHIVSSATAATTTKEANVNGAITNGNHLHHHQITTNKMKHLQWMDLRRRNNDDDTDPSLLSWESLGDCYTLLRSILGIDHHSSPWNCDNCEGNKQKQPNYEICVLAFPFEGDGTKQINALKDFRVSDASPSWFLHSIVNCENMEYNGSCLLDDASNYVSNSSPPATLFVYKRLPSRPRFMMGQKMLGTDQHAPLSQPNLCLSSATSLGCLWEQVLPGDDDEDDGKQQENNGHGELERKDEEQTIRLQCPPYVDLFKVHDPQIYEQLFDPETIQTFIEEAIRIPQWTPWPETQHYSSSGADGLATWRVFPLCYCFPANDVTKRKWVDATSAFCPKTCQILLDVLGCKLRTALFSQLSPNTTLAAHTGWADLANHVLRLHIPLIVPDKCGTWVDGCVQYHQVGKPILFDDSKIHRAFNYSDESRIVLIVDIERPTTSLPVGYATGGHSDELDAFIEQMGSVK